MLLVPASAACLGHSKVRKGNPTLLSVPASVSMGIYILWTIGNLWENKTRQGEKLLHICENQEVIHAVTTQEGISK